MISNPSSRATEQGLRDRADLYAVVFALAAAVTVTLAAFAPGKFLSSIAWQYVLEHMPGGQPVLVCWLLVAAIGMAAALKTRIRWPWWPYLLAGTWYLWVATFQLVCALNEPGGPLGFMGWGPYGIILTIYGLGQTRRFR